MFFGWDSSNDVSVQIQEYPVCDYITPEWNTRLCRFSNVEMETRMTALCVFPFILQGDSSGHMLIAPCYPQGCRNSEGLCKHPEYKGHSQCWQWVPCLLLSISCHTILQTVACTCSTTMVFSPQHCFHITLEQHLAECTSCWLNISWVKEKNWK